MRKELIFSISDLRYVCIECPNCHTRVILDMAHKTVFAEAHDTFVPAGCPGCKVKYDSAIVPSVDELQKAYQSLIGLKDRISFRGEATEE